jgi:hypothetical protein
VNRHTGTVHGWRIEDLCAFQEMFRTPTEEQHRRTMPYTPCAYIRCVMTPLERRRIGTTDLRVTRLGLGAGPLRAVTEATIATVQRALALGINYINTAPLYGLGTSERCIGRAVAGVNRDRYRISTKVGRLLRDAGLIHPDAPFPP